MVEKIYDNQKFTSVPVSEIKESNVLGLIPMNEVDSFSNRERYMCIVANQYQKIYTEQIESYDDALRSLIMEFGTTNGYEDNSKVDSFGSEALKKALNVLHAREGDPAFYIWGVHEGEA